MSDSDEGIDLEAITDEQTLHRLLDSTDDFDERKMIRARLQEIQRANRAKRHELIKNREDDREQHLRQKKQAADERKQQTLAMYDQMAKSSPAGAPKTVDYSILSGSDSGRSTPVGGGLIKRDLVEETIRQRKEEAEKRKKRILAAYDAAAKTQPAGAPKLVDFEAFKRADVSNFEVPKPVGACTFGMSGGIPQIKKVEGMTPPVTPSGYKPPTEWPEDDAYQRMVKQRQRECEENKRRILAGYDYLARYGEAGPKSALPEELKNFNVDQLPPKPKFSCTSGFKAGVPQVG